MTPDALKNRRLAGVFLLGWVFFNYPIFSLFSLPASWGGIPLLYACVFLIWALVIGLVMLITRRDGPPGEEGT
jgi:hypothetical protein